MEWEGRMEEVRTEVVTLAALLHDLGKFYQRAEGIRQGKHQDFSARFLREEKNREKLKRTFGLSDEEADLIALAAEKHHDSLKDPGDCSPRALFKVVKEADWLSAGLDRAYAEGVPQTQEEKKGIHRTLLPPFVLVRAKPGKRPNFSEIMEEERKWGYRFKELSLEAVFPVPTENYADEERKRDYAKLWESFAEKFLELPETGDFNFKLEALKNLLVRYAWCVPSYTYSQRKNPLADVSLAHHLFTTAAIATAIWRGRKEGAKGKQFHLLSVDFSGIQNFVFSPPKDTAKWGAKILRARSFLVSLAVEGVVRKILKEFGVNSSCVLLNAGGKALVLLPGVKDGKERVERVRKEVLKALLDPERGLFGEVKLKTALLPINGEDLKLENFEKTLGRLSNEEGREKFTLFKPEDLKESELIIRGYARKVAEKGLCKVCGKGIADEEVDGTPLCSLCNKLIKTGEDLPKSSYALVDFNGLPFPEVELLNQEELKNGLEGLKENEAIYAFSIAPEVPLPTKPLENAVPKVEEVDEKTVEECYDGNPPGKGSVKNFCHLARQAPGRYLAALKADLDNLGYIFARGFVKLKDGVPLLSVSRLATLSWFLDLFFSEVVKEEAKKKELYSVFSGGDDLFLIGPWDEVVEFEGWLRREFRRYSCENPSFTISAGIEVVKPTLPVRLVAEEVEEALKRAKNRGKSATTLFGRVIPADPTEEETGLSKLLKEVRPELQKLKSKLKSKSFLYKLITLSEMANSEEESPENLLWRPRLRHLIFRNFKAKTEEEKKEREELLKKLEKWIEEYSENLSEGGKEKDDQLYAAIATVILEGRKGEGAGNQAD